jgi:hypothetical protein
MEHNALINALEQRSNEIKSVQQDLSQRLMSLEQKSVGNIHGATTEGGLNLKSVMDSLDNSGNLTCKSVIPMTKSTLLQGTSAGYIAPTHANLGVTAANESSSLASQLPSIAIDGSVIHFTRLTSDDVAGEQGLEGNLKKELNVVATPVEAESRTWAGWLKISTQSLSDQKSIESAITTVMTETVLKALSAHAVAVATTEGSAGTAGATPLVSALTAAAMIESRGYKANVFVNPIDYIGMVLSQDSNGQFIQFPTAFVAALKPASGVTVGSYVATAANGEGLVMAMKEGINLDIGTVNDDFQRNIRTLLIEARGLAVVKNTALVISGSLATLKAK